MYASQKVQVFARLRRSDTHFRHAQGHQRASALIGFIVFIQKTTTAVNGVEHRKTINI